MSTDPAGTAPPLPPPTAPPFPPPSGSGSVPLAPHREGPPLLRRRDDRVLRGVCAAVGRATGTDPLLWRVLVAVLVLAGGSGLVLYGAGWLLIPEERTDATGAPVAHRSVPTRAALLVLFGVAALALPGVAGARFGGAAPLAVLALLLLLLLRDPSERPAPPAAPPTGLQPYTASRADLLALQPPWAPEEVLPPPYDTSPALLVPRPRRRRSALGPLTVGAALLVTGGLLALSALGVAGITAGRVLAVALLVVGAGLLVGARRGRSRGLVLLAALLALLLGGAASTRVPVDLSAGDRTWVAVADGSYRLGVGQATLDLRDAAPGARLQVRVGAGDLRVLLPQGKRLELRGHLGAGEVHVHGPKVQDGTDLDLGANNVVGQGQGEPVVLDARIGVGQLEVLP